MLFSSCEMGWYLRKKAICFEYISWILSRICRTGSSIRRRRSGFDIRVLTHWARIILVSSSSVSDGALPIPLILIATSTYSVIQGNWRETYPLKKYHLNHRGDYADATLYQYWLQLAYLIMLYKYLGFSIMSAVVCKRWQLFQKMILYMSDSKRLFKRLLHSHSTNTLADCLYCIKCGLGRGIQ